MHGEFECVGGWMKGGTARTVHVIIAKRVEMLRLIPFVTIGEGSNYESQCSVECG